MFTTKGRFTTALNPAPDKVQILPSTVPHFRPRRLRIAALVLAGLFVMDLGVSAVHADTSLPIADTSIILAQQSADAAPDNRRGPPPREAIAACDKKVAEDVCTFTIRDSQQVDGTCRSPQADAPTVCVPDQMP